MVTLAAALVVTGMCFCEVLQTLFRVHKRIGCILLPSAFDKASEGRGGCGGRGRSGVVLSLLLTVCLSLNQSFFILGKEGGCSND